MPIGASLGRDPPQSGALLPQPTYIKRLVQGVVHEAWQSQVSPHRGRKVRSSPAQRAGRAYENHVAAALPRICGGRVIIRGPWFVYADDSSVRGYCQPDFLLDSGPGRAMVVVEAKIRFHCDAWWQIEKLYRPVVEKVYRDRQIFSLCICRSFDPATAVPERPTLVESLNELVPGAFNVMVVK